MLEDVHGMHDASVGETEKEPKEHAKHADCPACARNKSISIHCDIDEYPFNFARSSEKQTVVHTYTRIVQATRTRHAYARVAERVGTSRAD